MDSNHGCVEYDRYLNSIASYVAIHRILSVVEIRASYNYLCARQETANIRGSSEVDALRLPEVFQLRTHSHSVK